MFKIKNPIKYFEYTEEDGKLVQFAFFFSLTGNSKHFDTIAEL